METLLVLMEDSGCESMGVTLGLIYVLFACVRDVSFVLVVCGQNIGYIVVVEGGSYVRLLCVRFAEALF